MVDQSLIDYIKSAKDYGMSEQEIRSSLLAKGWEEKDVDVSLQSLQEKTTPVVPEKNEEPEKQMVSFSNFTSSPISSGEVSQVANEVQYSKKSRKIAITIGLIVVLLVGYVFVYALDVASLFAPYKSGDSFVEGVKKLAGVKTLHYTMEFSVKAEDKDLGAVAFKFDKEKEEEDLKAKTPRFERDRDRFIALAQVSDDLVSYHRSGGKYPPSLEFLAAVTPTMMAYGNSTVYEKYKDVVDNSFLYGRSRGGEGYTLTVNFETAEALSVVSQGNPYNKPKAGVEKPVVTSDLAVFNEKTGNNVYYFSGVPTKSPVVQFVEDQAIAMENLPSDFSIFAKMYGEGQSSVKKEDWSEAQANMTLEGSASFGDSTFAFDLDSILDGTDTYIKINKIPGLPIAIGGFDPTSLKGKWIKISESDILNNLPDYNARRADSLERSEDAKDLYSRIFKIIVDNKLILLSGRPKRDRVDGTVAYKYNFAINRDSINAVYKGIIDEVNGNQKFSELLELPSSLETDPEVASLLESKLFKEYMDYLKENNEFSIWFTRDGIPVKIGYSSRIIPSNPSSRWENKQLVIDISYAISNLNEPVFVEVPDEYTNFSKLVKESFGGGASLEDARSRARDARKRAELNQIQLALELYFDACGRYPASLNISANQGCQSGVSLGNFIPSIPVQVNVIGDSSEEVPYGYRYEGKGYCIGAMLEKDVADLGVTSSCILPGYNYTKSSFF